MKIVSYYLLNLLFNVFINKFLSSNKIISPIRTLQQNVNIKPTIIGGTKAPPNSFTYTASLRFNNNFYCGGALISRNIVLTAAHCIETFIPTQVMVGTNDNSKFVEEKFIYEIESYKIHPEYYRSPKNILYYDVAIIKLTKEVNIHPLRLGINSPEQLESGITTGWGCIDQPKDVTYECTIPKSLRIGTTTFLDESECTYLLDKNNLLDSSWVDKKSSVLCTKNNNIYGPCFGDSGGPLIVNEVLVGITSWGIECGPSQYPFGFAKVSELRNFIDEYSKGHEWVNNKKRSSSDQKSSDGRSINSSKKNYHINYYSYLLIFGCILMTII